MGLKLTSSALFLMVANTVPVFGVLYFGWDAAAILVLYWLESVIIGVLNVPKILSVRKPEDSHKLFFLGNLFTACFFAVHYGMFTGIHGAFLAELFEAKPIMEGLLSGGPILWTAFSFLFSHVFSMLINFYGKKEYLGRQPKDQMFKPYGRVVVMHLVVLLGGVLIKELGSPIYAIILLVVLKTIIDLVAHSRSHAGKDIVTT